MMTGQAARSDAIRRMQAIYRKARELAEERGLAASYLVTGQRVNDPSMSPNDPSRPFCGGRAGAQSDAPAGAPREFRGFCYECGLCRSRYAAFVVPLCGHAQFRLTVKRTTV
jgi:hypothetical protein